ncbi:protein furry-like [Uloborus diversus]|uniref:protein furry-like n=1 Tax=Uloborus diversus TaxID=327109 RepID=UPI00240951CB|nr:protein furry-like [Uloborus diversus]
MSSSNESKTQSNCYNICTQCQLPWGVRKERQTFPSGINIDIEAKPGEFILRTLFAEFTVQAERKIDLVLAESLERPLSKSLQRGEDALFDQLLSAFGSVAEHCLPSLLRTLYAWYDRQGVDSSSSQDFKLKVESKSKSDIQEKTEKDHLQERRDLAVEFIFCLVLIEVLKQLSVHPGHDDLVNYIENLAFKHFRFREGAQTGPNAQNVNIIADLYAEVIGVLAQSRFQSVRKRFVAELKELRCKEPNPITTQSIISLLMGMKFFRVKMVPIEEFEASFQFMQECATYFLEVKDKDIKHALAGLFVEILVPVAATVKNEVNVPCLKTFVEMLYSHTLDLCTKKKHSLALFPLVTCLLCVSQKPFFLQNWHYFLAMCLSHLKNRDPKMCRVALESLYRLLWVYMIRIKCESNTATQSRLQSIVNSLFPKGSKAIVPRDTPLNIFVKIIQFVAQERLDFAMKEIVFDLLSVGRPIKIILTPERMSIALRAFLVVADSLQQKEGDPPMPRTVGVLPSGNTLRVKKTFLNKMLTDETARTIGMSHYYPYVRKVFDDILKALDVQFGRPLMMTTVQNINKEKDDMIAGERKPKIDLFRTCVAAVPRLIPDGMSRHDLVDLLSRLTVHIDEELRALAFQSLQNMTLDFPDWREDVIYGFVQFMLREVNDTFPQLLDNALCMLLQFLTNWKNSLSSHSQNSLKKDSREQNKIDHLCSVLHLIEAVALVMLCHCRVSHRRLAVHILKETKSLLKTLVPSCEEDCVTEAIDQCCPLVAEKCLPLLPPAEKAALLSASHIDLQWLTERNSSAWTSGLHDTGEGSNKASSNLEISENSGLDPWCVCLLGFIDNSNLLKRCPTAVAHSWPIVYSRITTLFSYLDLNPVSDNRASLLRPTVVKKALNERENHLTLWRNYLMFACRLAPPNCAPPAHFIVTELSLSSSPDSISSERSDSRSPNNASVQVSSLFKQITPLLRSEQADMRDAIVFGLSKVNHLAVKDLMEELVVYIREAIDRKQENVRRRRRRDVLRVQLARVLELIAEQGTFGISNSVLDRDASSLNTTFVEYIDGARLYLETENDKDVPSIVQEIKQHFCGFIHKLIKSFTLENRNNLLGCDLRRNLFYLFASWSGKYSSHFGIGDRKSSKEEPCSDFEFSALQAMSAVLCCGPCFDPQGISEEGPFYAWLNCLLNSESERIYLLAQETVVLLLEFNSDCGMLLDWLVDCCYTGDIQMADGCFNALATIFSAREYPCDHYMAIINVTLLNTGCPRSRIQETALQLLQILDHRFFSCSTSLSVDGETDAVNKNVLLRKKLPQICDVLFSTGYPCTQMQLSHHLAQLHPELTMPIFSEITYRLQTARPPVRQNLLQYALPWLYNMELVDPNITQCSPLAHLSRIQEFCSTETCQSISLDRREGWGSAEATEMVLNNLFYITAKFGDSHPQEIEELWASLCKCWPNNLKVIIRYLFIITGLAPNELLVFAKRVVLFMAKARPEKLLDEMMADMQTVETLNCLIERTETPPFFRVTSIRKESSHSDDGGSSSQPDAPRTEITLERGTLHTKRHSTESGCEKDSQIRKDTCSADTVQGVCSITNTCKGNHAPSSTGASDDGQNTVISSVEEENFLLLCHVAEDNAKPETPQPHPLPMPEFGGYYAPLTEFLPDSSQPVTGFHRCNLAVMLLADVIDGINIDWTPHVPLMLHVIFLGLDHTRPLVHLHCKTLLLKLLIVLAKHEDHLGIAKILLSNKTQELGYGLPAQALVARMNFTEQNLLEEIEKKELVKHTSIDETESTSSREHDSSSCETLANEEAIITQALETNKIASDVEGTVKSLIDFLASKKGSALWSYEDITAKVWSVKSAEQLTTFLQNVLFVFKESVPSAHIQDRWAQIALQLALSCSSRHYAGRSLQIFRALKVPLNARMLSDILSRLVETVTEQGEDMQGYVTELMLTLEEAIDSLDSAFKISDIMRDFFKSTPNLNKESNRKSAPPITISHSGHSCGSSNPLPMAINHQRSTSYSGKKYPDSPTLEVRDIRHRSNTDIDVRLKSNNLGRSRSAQSLKMADEQFSQEDRTTLLAQFFWIAVSLLESDYEYEFLLALRLLEKVLTKLPLERTDYQEKLEKIQMQLKWSNFPGVHALLLKGCASPNTFDPTTKILTQFTSLLDIPVVDPSESLAFPFHVMALLPYLLLNYDDPSTLCIKSAENIAQVCMEKSKKLENLATVMMLYSRRSFSKESFQWTKCVVKYLYDAYCHVFLNLITFLVEILEKGPQNLIPHVLGILYCVLHYLDVTTSAQTINADLLRVISRYIEGPQWKDALKILKLVVTRSSTLAAPPAPFSIGTSAIDSVSIASNTSFADSEFGSKRELPGRTMDFTIDLSLTPIIGQRYLLKDSPKDSEKEGSTASPRRSLSHNHSFTENGSVGWKRPWLSQARTREHLIGLLTSCGQRVGLPKSPSVIFSQSSDIIEHQSSMCSSTEEISATNNESAESKLEDSHPEHAQFGVFKDFDFLEYELESQEGESMDNFNWGVRRRSLSNYDGSADDISKPKLSLNTSNSTLSPRKEESSDDEMGSVSPLDDVHPDMPSSSSGYAFPPSSLPLSDHRRRPISPASGSTHSLASDGDLTLSNTSPSFSPFVGIHLPAGSEDVDDLWRSHVRELMADATGNVAANTYQTLSRLFKEVFRRVTRLTRECCQLISQMDAFRRVASHFLTMLDCQVECPFIYIDPEIMLHLERHKFCVLEIQEHWETFLEKQEHTMECMDSLRSAFKLEQLGETIPEGTIEEHRIDLCRCLYKLHFQLLLLLESYAKLLQHLSAGVQQAHIVDLSQDITSVKNEVVRAVEDTESDRLSPSEQPDVSDLSNQEAETILVELIHTRKWGKAIRHLHCYRSIFPGSIFGNTEEDDVDVILGIYAKHLCENRTGYFMMSQEEHDIGDVCRQLMDISLQLSSVLHGLEHAHQERSQDSSFRRSEC